MGGIMRLRNKKTGEIGWLLVGAIFTVLVDGEVRAEYATLAELNAEWTDYKEPEGFWMINILGIVEYTHGLPENEVKMMKEIGNYFETKEEAEKAIEKLRAWQRLKDKGFRFSEDWVYRYDQPKVENHTYFEFVAICEDGIRFDDLDLLFSQEEN